MANGTDNTVSVLLGLGDGGFAPQVTYRVGANPRGVSVGDLNGDGAPDIVTANQNDNTISVLLNGAGTFAPEVTYAVGVSPQALGLGDFDGDGNLDLAVANSDTDDIAVLLNLGDGGTFGAPAFYPWGGWCRSPWRSQT